MRRYTRKGACLIVLGGEIPAPDLVRRAARGCQEVICADGALTRARRLGLWPQFVVGDMDSLPKAVPVRRGMIFWCDFDLNRSDFQKCLDLAIHRGFARAYVAGALGGRLDHAAINLAVAERASNGLEVILLDRGVGRVLGPGVHRLQVPAGAVFSLLPLAKARVNLSGCRYPLKNFLLHRGSRGLSNRARNGPVVLRVRSGRLWFFSELS